jgi:hypothetical protein
VRDFECAEIAKPDDQVSFPRLRRTKAVDRTVDSVLGEVVLRLDLDRVRRLQEWQQEHAWGHDGFSERLEVHAFADAKVQLIEIVSALASHGPTIDVTFTRGPAQEASLRTL